MSDDARTPSTISIAFDDFFYYFLQLRKNRIRAVVKRLRTLHPEEGPEALAERLISSHAYLSLWAGSIFHVPGLLPGIGSFLRGLNLVAGTSVLSRMHLYLILEIALLFGKDIDDPARVPEMMAVVGVTGAAVVGPTLLVRALHRVPIVGIPAAGLTATATTRLIGRAAIKLYGEAPEPASASSPSE